MKLRVLDRDGMWVTTRKWSFSFWWPRAHKPFGIRTGRYGRHGWWGAANIRRVIDGD